MQPRPAVHFSVDLPSDLYVTARELTGASMAVSPDGATIAFLATGRDGVRHVMVRAIDDMTARTVPGTACAQTRIAQGDARDGSIAAASIVAKVHRDAIMRRLEDEHPGYGFARHMGYATREHLAALRRLGPSPVHRRSFAPCAQLPLL